MAKRKVKEEADDPTEFKIEVTKYPPALCKKCGQDLELQGSRGWKWDGKKLIGPYCKRCK